MDFHNSTAMRLRRAYMTLHRHAQTHFAHFSVTADQYVVLSTLAEEDGISQRELAEASCSDANTITAMLKLLENKGLVRRRPDRSDNRARIVFLSAKGRKLQERLASSAEPIHQAMQAAVGEADWTRLGKSLTQIEGAIRAFGEKVSVDQTKQSSSNGVSVHKVNRK